MSGITTELGVLSEFEELVIRYERKVFNLIYRIIGDYHDAADLTQDTFIRAFKGFSKFRREADPYTWLSKIAINLTRDYMKAKQRRLPTQEILYETEEGEVIDLLDEIPDWSASPEQVLERKELQELVHKAINSLPQEFREVIVLRDLQELSYQEVANILDISIDLVKVRIFRARKLLKEKLAPYFKL